MASGVFTLNLGEEFPRLSNPPVIEAVIHWQARPDRKINLQSLQADLPNRFPGFPKITPMHAMDLSPRNASVGEAGIVHPHEILGYRLGSDTSRGSVQVFRDGLAYSVVKGYSHWDSFCREAIDAWGGFVDLASPKEIQRLGVRFINHFPTLTVGTLGNVLRESPLCPANLSLMEFVDQSSFDVPSYEYGVRVIKVLQAPMTGMRDASGLFLDIEAYTTKAIPNDQTGIDEALKNLRWLKNKVFFSLLTESAIKAFS